MTPEAQDKLYLILVGLSSCHIIGQFGDAEVIVVVVEMVECDTAKFVIQRFECV